MRGKTLLLCIDGEESAWLKQFLSAFRAQNPRENVVFLSREFKDSGHVVDGIGVPYPFGLPGMRTRFLRKLRVGLIVVDDGVQPPPGFIDRARRERIVIATLAGGALAYSQSINDGVVFSGQSVNGLSKRKAEDAATWLSAAMASERAGHVKLKKRLRYWIWRHLFYRFQSQSLKKCYQSDELGSVLGHPKSILCLGNGPSAEDPQLDGMDYDSLFRVNHRWLDRDILAQPDAVFTGAVDSVLAVGRNIVYGFIHDERAMRMVMRAHQEVSALKFTSVEDLGFDLSAFSPHQPTNGLLMLYTAITLNPEVLIVAGIDLFRDPRGAYPDPGQTPNHYTSAHDEDKELACLLSMLYHYKGELRIIGDALSTEFDRYVQAMENSGNAANQTPH
jgi:hypothetical protein